MIPGSTCGNCDLWIAPGRLGFNSARGQCRRFSPSLWQSNDGLMHTAWPMTSPADWCGDHSVITANEPAG